MGRDLRKNGGKWRKLEKLLENAGYPCLLETTASIPNFSILIGGKEC